MIKSWKHIGLKELFLVGSRKGVRPDIAHRLSRRLDVLDSANSLKALGLPGFSLHPLSGEMKGMYSIKVTRNFRLTFRFKDGDIFELNLEDYHGK